MASPLYALDQSDETVSVTDMCRSLAMDLLSSAAKLAEANGETPASCRDALFDTGLLAAVPEEFGGGGQPSCRTLLAAVEALAYGDPALTLASAWSGSLTSFVARLGTDNQKHTILTQFALSANARGAIALHEGYGRAPSESTASFTAEPSGFHIRGTKVFVSCADAADPMLVIGTDTHRNLRAALIRPGLPGVTIHAKQRHLALDAADFRTVTFDCHVPSDALLHDDAETLDILIAQHRLLAAAAMLGCAYRAVDYASAYANERIAFGKPISAFQGVSFLLADNAIRLAASRIELQDIATRIDAQLSEGLEGRTTEALNYTGTVTTQATRDALQVLGGHGFITDHPVERWYRSTAAIAAIDFDPLCSTFEPAS